MDTQTARLLVGFGALIRGAASTALEVFEELKHDSHGIGDAALVHEGLGYAYILLNDMKRAHAAMEHAAELPGARVSALAWSLNLALRTGSEVEIDRAAARLDLLVAGTSTEFAACLARMRASRSLLAEIEGHAFGEATRLSLRVSEWARECRSSSGRVARTME